MVKRLPPWVLFAAAAIVLSLAVAHFVSRVAKPDVRAPGATPLQQRMQQEIALRKSELDRDRAAIVARIQSLQQAGDHVAALQIAGRYYPTQDPEILALYRQSAEIEGRRQRLAEARKLVQEQCTEASAWKGAEEALHDLGGADVLARRKDLELTRLQSGDVLPLVLAQLRGDPGALLPKKPDPTEPPGHEHHVQVHPDFAIGLRTGSDQSDLICAWRLAARPRAARALQRFELVFWLAPLPNRMLDAEPLRYSPASPR